MPFFGCAVLFEHTFSCYSVLVTGFLNQEFSLKIANFRHSSRVLNQQDLDESNTLDDSEISSSLNETMPPLIDEQQSRPSSKKKPTPSRATVKKPKAPSKLTDTDDEGMLETSLLLSSVPSSTTPKIVIKNSTLNSSKSGGSKSKSSSSKKGKSASRDLEA